MSWKYRSNALKLLRTFSNLLYSIPTRYCALLCLDKTSTSTSTSTLSDAFITRRGNFLNCNKAKWKKSEAKCVIPGGGPTFVMYLLGGLWRVESAGHPRDDDARWLYLPRSMLAWLPEEQLTRCTAIIRMPRVSTGTSSLDCIKKLKCYHEKHYITDIKCFYIRLIAWLKGAFKPRIRWLNCFAQFQRNEPTWKANSNISFEAEEFLHNRM